MSPLHVALLLLLEFALLSFLFMNQLGRLTYSPAPRFQTSGQDVWSGPPTSYSSHGISHPAGFESALDCILPTEFCFGCFLKQHADYECAKPISSGTFLCHASCPTVEPELEDTFRILNIAKYSLEGLLRLCRHEVFPYLVVIQNNIVTFAKCQNHPSGKTEFQRAMALLSVISCAVKLPDVVFGFDGNDYAIPQASSPLKYTSNGYMHPLLGVLRFVGVQSSPTALFPTHPFVKASGFSSLESKSIKDAMKLRERKDDEIPWEQLNNSLVWRGGSTGMPFDSDFTFMMPRPSLVKLASRERGFDVGFTTYDGVSSAMKAQGFEKDCPRAPFFEKNQFQKYRYLVHADGNTASWGLSSKVFSNRVIVWVASSVGFREHYYSLLKPWKHFIPVQADLSNLLQIRDWLNSDSGIDEAKMIADRLKELRKMKFRPENIWCYVIRLIESTAKLQDFSLIDHIPALKKEFEFRHVAFHIEKNG